MENDMIKKFQEAMDAMSDEEFLAIWDELGGNEPRGDDDVLAKDLIASFPKNTQPIGGLVDLNPLPETEIDISRPETRVRGNIILDISGSM